MTPLLRVFTAIAVATGLTACATEFSYDHVCSDAEECRSIGIDTRDAICAVKVTGLKAKQDVEKNYLPAVMYCENNAARGEALKALAVAARSYLYYVIDQKGYITSGQKEQVSRCGYKQDPNDRYHKAVEATSGEVLRYDDLQIVGFHAAGSTWPDAAGEKPATMYAVSTCESKDRAELATCCDGPNGGPTESYVTYNYNHAGAEVLGTSLGSRKNPQNRGLLSQNGAECLANHKFDYRQILAFYYGRDIGITRSVGTCVNQEPGTYTEPQGDGTDENGGSMLPPSDGAWIGDTCDGTAESCNFTANGRTGECVEFAGTGTSGPSSLYGVCSIDCAGYCPDRSGETQTFCAQLANGTGQCEVLPTAAGGCTAVAGTLQRAMWRYVGSSGAPSVLRAACVPPAEGISCMGGAGVCVDRDYPGACQGGTLTPGFCPGGSDIQCCDAP